MPLATRQDYKRKIEELRQRKQRKPGDNPNITKRIQHLKKRKSKLGIPDVDENPKPPNDPNKNKDDKKISGPLPGPGQTLTQVGATQTGNATPATPLDRETQGFSTYQPAPGKPDPRDDRYWSDLARMMFEKNQKLSDINTQGVYATTDYEQALEGLTRQQPRDIQDIREAANTAGAFYSSATGEAVGRTEQAYQTERGGVESQYQRENAMRELMRSQIEQGYTVDEAAALAEALTRQSESELDRPPPPGKGPAFKPKPKKPKEEKPEKPGKGEDAGKDGKGKPKGGKGKKKNGSGKRGGPGDPDEFKSGHKGKPHDYLRQLRRRINQAEGSQKQALKRRYRRYQEYERKGSHGKAR